MFEHLDTAPPDAILGLNVAFNNDPNPDKINLASLGNQVAHIHWHVIPRYTHDRHFPDAIWAQPNRESPPQATLSSQQLQTWLKPALDNLDF